MHRIRVVSVVPDLVANVDALAAARAYAAVLGAEWRATERIGSTMADDLRRRLPQLVRRLKQVDLFIHDSLHTARNTCFELDTVWPVLAPDGVVVVDDIDRSLGFSRFINRAAPAAWVAAKHVIGSGLWGAAIKAGRPRRTVGGIGCLGEFDQPLQLRRAKRHVGSSRLV
jgi:hypothetical protein